jgi:uncharacterized protein
VSAQTFHLPIFPLNAVLFPGGVLPLKVFERRYMDMVRTCMRRKEPFGVCLIAAGNEVGALASPHSVGCIAHITAWDMAQPGVLNITVRGGERLRILEHSANRHGLILASAVGIEPEPHVAVPETLSKLLPLLRAIAADKGAQRMPEPHAFDDAVWVGYRYAEVLPIPLAARQELLELSDPVSRLEIIFKFLSQRGLIG